MQKTLSVEMLKNMFLGAAQNLEIHKEEINAHNVFPVPDGDTGTNMSATASAAVKELNDLNSDSLTFETFAKAVSVGSLRGARGNSGVILSQVFKGFCSTISEITEELTMKQFAKALLEGAKVAYSAVNVPKEGTILTVVRVVAESALSAIGSGKNASFENMMQKLITTGKNILAETPNMLPVLKKAGVVDAGGMGFICVLEAFSMVLEGKELPTVSVVVEEKNDDNGFPVDMDNLDDIEFAYCTEFFVKNLRPRATEADIDKLRDKLAKLGNSLIVIGDLSLVKVHVHTNNPGRALQAALELGELDKVKIENMLEQNRKIKEELERTKKPIGIISVCAGDGFRAMFKDLLVDVIIEGGQTMNPSVNEIVSAINRVNADNVIVLPNNKNIILAAQKALELTKRKCEVLPTENVAAGLAAVIAFDPTASFGENVVNMSKAANDIKCAQVTTAVRAAKIDGLSLSKGDIIGLDDKKILNKGKRLDSVVIDLIKKMGAETLDVLNLYAGEGVSEDEAQLLTQKINEAYPNLEVINYQGNQPHSFYILAAQ